MDAVPRFPPDRSPPGVQEPEAQYQLNTQADSGYIVLHGRVAGDEQCFTAAGPDFPALRAMNGEGRTGDSNTGDDDRRGESTGCLSA